MIFVFLCQSSLLIYGLAIVCVYIPSLTSGNVICALRHKHLGEGVANIWKS